MRGNIEIILGMNPIDPDKYSLFKLLGLVCYYFTENFCIYFLSIILISSFHFVVLWYNCLILLPKKCDWFLFVVCFILFKQHFYTIYLYHFSFILSQIYFLFIQLFIFYLPLKKKEEIIQINKQTAKKREKNSQKHGILFVLASYSWERVLA